MVGQHQVVIPMVQGLDLLGFFVTSYRIRDDTARASRLLSDAHIETIQSLRRSAEGRAVPLPGEPPLDDNLITLLAGGFSKGEKGAPAIPYVRLAD